jgi:hypothetical protein
MAQSLTYCPDFWDHRQFHIYPTLPEKSTEFNPSPSEMARFGTVLSYRIIEIWHGRKLEVFQK